MKHMKLCALVFAGIGLGGIPMLNSCSSTEPMHEQVDDSAITTKIKAKLMADTSVKGRDVSVDTVEGTVYLTGRVQSDEESRAAERIARETSGVKKVVNNLKVGDRT